MNDQDAIFKTRVALREADLSEEQIDRAVRTMQDYNLLPEEFVGPEVYRLFD